MGSESRFLPTPPALDAPVRGVLVGISSEYTDTMSGIDLYIWYSEDGVKKRSI